MKFHSLIFHYYELLLKCINDKYVLPYGTAPDFFIKLLTVKYKNMLNEYIKYFYVILKCKIGYLWDILQNFEKLQIK